MQDTLTPNVLKARFSRKIIQVKALAAMAENMNRQNKDKQYQLLLVTSAGKITGDYCETYCSDESCCQLEDSLFDVSMINEFANKVLIDAENEIVNIEVIDNGHFIKFNNAKICSHSSDQVTELPQLIVFADHIVAFTLVEKK